MSFIFKKKYIYQKQTNGNEKEKKKRQKLI